MTEAQGPGPINIQTDFRDIGSKQDSSPTMFSPTKSNFQESSIFVMSPGRNKPKKKPPVTQTEYKDF